MNLIHINLLPWRKKFNVIGKKNFLIIVLGFLMSLLILNLIYLNAMKKREAELKKQFEIKLIKSSQQADQMNLTKVSQKPIYSKGHVSLNFQDMNVRTALQFLADFKELNLIVSDSVKGNVTSRLNNVPWEQTLDIILKTQGLDKRQIGNVLWVASKPEILEYERQEIENKNQIEEFQPSHSEWIQINYAKASDIAQFLKEKGNALLSADGSVNVDARTNSLWIHDRVKKIENIRHLVYKLDVPSRQVLIEARIVIVDKAFEKDLGVRFGMSDSSHFSSTLDGTDSLSQGNSSSAAKLKKRLNLDLPALPSSSTPATVGFALAKLGKDILLDLELSALESEGRGEIISSPRLVTANQQEAVIQAGEEIPYQQSTPTGATSTAFKKAVLSLRVTPQITSDNKIILDLVVNQDEPAPQVFNGVPAIKTKEIQTKVLVDNGQTLVLGGIYKQAKRSDVKQVPVLGSLPVVGFLFRSESTDNAREELLIFVTPKIILETAVVSGMRSATD
ncbi:MAG: type IV pilus secretin PilQ [Proteobacteria bacterium]|nr:type IV pilus secretin PilQ [Pseudomonadota bacterium]